MVARDFPEVQFSKSTRVLLLSLFHMCDLITFPICNGIMKTVFFWQHLQLCKCQNNAKKPPALCWKNYLGEVAGALYGNCMHPFPAMPY